MAATVNYSYDSAGRLIKVDYGTGGSISYTYDNAGNLLSRTIVSAAQAAAQKSKAVSKGNAKSKVKPELPATPPAK